MNLYNIVKRFKALSPLKKAFVKSIFYLLISFIGVLIFTQKQFPYQLISIACLIFGLWHFILLVAYAQFLIDEIWPPKYDIDIKLPKKIKEKELRDNCFLVFSTCINDN